MKILCSSIRCVRMLDIRDQDFTGRPLFDIVCNKAERILRDVLKTQRGQTLEFELPWPNRTIKVITAPIRPKVKHSRTIGTLIIIRTLQPLKAGKSGRILLQMSPTSSRPLTSIKGFIET